MTEKTLTVGSAQPNFAPDVKPPGDRAAPRTRRRLFAALGIFAAIAAIAYLATRWFAPPSEDTDDAYVGGNIVSVTAREADDLVRDAEIFLALVETTIGLVHQPVLPVDSARAS